MSFQKGPCPTRLTVCLEAQNIIRVLSLEEKEKLDKVMLDLNTRGVLTVEDYDRIKHLRETESKECCIDVLVCCLEDKTEIQLESFIDYLKGVQSTRFLGTHIENVYQRCQLAKVDAVKVSHQVDAERTSSKNPQHKEEDLKQRIQSTKLKRKYSAGKRVGPLKEIDEIWVIVVTFMDFKDTVIISCSSEKHADLFASLDGKEVTVVLQGPEMTPVAESDQTNTTGFYDSSTVTSVILQSQSCSTEQEAYPIEIQQDPTEAVCSGDENPHCELEPLQLRPYQKELADCAKEGKNTLIAAPTGCGKTYVALGISKAHFESMEVEDPKIAFIVPTRGMIEQLSKLYKTFIGSSMNKKIFGVTEDDSDNQILKQKLLINEYDIFVLTPQILVNALEKKVIPSLGVFTLVILDQCHHTVKEHPYNMLMHMYFEERCANQRITLPQIVGLTAGVKTSHNLENIVTDILTLCANLDAHIYTVKREKQSLKEFAYKPEEAIDGRQDDLFKQHISKLMVMIEDKLKEEADKGACYEDISWKIITPPLEKGSEQYFQWVMYYNRRAGNIHDQETRKKLAEYMDYLEHFNVALFLNASCRTKDAFDYLVRNHNPTLPPVEDWLGKLYKDVEAILQIVSEVPQYRNPKLEKLKSVILNCYKSQKEVRGILLCKTKELTYALENWMREEPDMKFLNPGTLSGFSSPVSEDGMTKTQTEIKYVQKGYKDRSPRLIITTEVALEGLDPSKCNVVIRYDLVTNETARIQAKGRAKVPIENDIINKMREELMEMAIASIKSMSEAEYNKKINELQQKAKVIREQNKTGKRAITPYDDFQLHCRQCEIFACMASDIRTIEASDHIVTADEFENLVDARSYPHSKQRGRFNCKKCHSQWGTTMEYNNQRFYVIGLKGFLLCESNGKRKLIKKWKDVPFKVPSLSYADIQAMFPGAKPEDWAILQ